MEMYGSPLTMLMGITYLSTVKMCWSPPFLYLDGMIVDILVMVFQLCSRMDGLSTTKVCIQGHDGNDGAMLHCDDW